MPYILRISGAFSLSAEPSSRAQVASPCSSVHVEGSLYTARASLGRAHSSHQYMCGRSTKRLPVQSSIEDPETLDHSHRVRHGQWLQRHEIKPDGPAARSAERGLCDRQVRLERRWPTTALVPRRVMSPGAVATSR